MSEASASSYEEIPYESRPFFHTHPDHLASLGTLLGMRPTPVERCRVLELGSAAGGNLIPMAWSLPESQFVGIDLSPRQIADGRTVVEALGLENIDLQPLSILDVGEDFGQFDYIVCHGVYSWVPPEVQAKILQICQRNLTPQGLAYISYNTYPGWHMRRMVREMMCFHVRRTAEPLAKVRQARAFLDFLAESVESSKSAYAGQLAAAADELRKPSDSYLLHEFLEVVNEPLYFHEFAARAAAHGLQYVTEARLSEMAYQMPEEIGKTLSGWCENITELEQYRDFLDYRTFRRSILCHESVELKRPPSAEALMTLCLTAHARPTSPEPDVYTAAVEEFRSPEGVSVSTNNPLIKCLLVELYQRRPRTIPFDALWAAVEDRLTSAPPDAAPVEHNRLWAARLLLQCCLGGLVEVHTHAPRFVLEAGERPLASSLARLQAQASNEVTNLRHYTYYLNELEQFVLQRLDGKQNRAALLAALAQAVANGDLTFERDDQPVAEPSPALLSELLETCLLQLARETLLIA